MSTGTSSSSSRLLARLGTPIGSRRHTPWRCEQLEVLDRNGARPVRIRHLGPLNPIAGFFVQQVAHFIVRTHQSSVVDRMLRLYGRREANCQHLDPTRRMLRRSRIHMERLAPGFRRSAFGIPVFLLGGALFSTLLTLLQRAVASALKTTWSRAVATIIIRGLMAVIAWVILRGAAVARRRIPLTLDAPIEALWETIGRCGDPPRDPSRMFGLLAVILALLPWVLIPTGLLVSWLSGLF